jgi:hypothetical protein
VIAALLSALLLLAPDQVSDLNDRARAALDAKKPAEAVPLLQQACKLAPNEPVLQKNLAWALFCRGEDFAAEQRFNDALTDMREAWRLNPEEPGYAAHAGQILLRQYRLDEAEKLLGDATLRNPNAADAWLLLGDSLALQSELPEALEAYGKAATLGTGQIAEVAHASVDRTQRQYAIEKDYRTDRTAYFDILGPTDTGGPLYASRLAAVLEKARAQVCAELGVHPEHRVTVVLYPAEAFRQVTGTHEWVGGLFDRKIRLPIGDVDRDAAQIEAAFRHEFTHVIVSELAPNCPTFVNEGLAQVMEFGRGNGMKRLASWLDGRKGGREALPQISALPATFIDLTDGDAVTTAYLESHAFIDWLVGLNGTGPVVNFVRELDGQPLDKAFQTALRRPLDEQEQQFRDALKAFRG